MTELVFYFQGKATINPIIVETPTAEDDDDDIEIWMIIVAVAVAVLVIIVIGIILYCVSYSIKIMFFICM